MPKTKPPKKEAELIPPYCQYCGDTCQDPDDPTGQHDCRYCGGMFAWRQRAAYHKRMERKRAKK